MEVLFGFSDSQCPFFARKKKLWFRNLSLLKFQAGNYANVSTTILKTPTGVGFVKSDEKFVFFFHRSATRTKSNRPVFMLSTPFSANSTNSRRRFYPTVVFFFLFSLRIYRTLKTYYDIM